MDAAERFLRSMEGGLASSFKRRSTQRHDQATSDHSDYFVDSTPTPSDHLPRHDYMIDASNALRYDDLEDEHPLDDFGTTGLPPEVVCLPDIDRQLLAERTNERQWQASQGFARLSFTPSAGHRQNVTGMRANTPDSSYVGLTKGQGSGSSPYEPMSSPTKCISVSRDRHHSSQRVATYNRHHPKSPSKISYTGHLTRHTPATADQLQLRHAPPIIQGIRLVPTTSLPDRFHTLFPYSIFNAVQSKTYDTAFSSDDNLVLAAPTGSGKTAVMELAICRLISNPKHEDFKVVYQAPTKSLCAERFNDWNGKFPSLGLNLAELTADTQYAQLKSVQNASIIITTPEKWDSVTRKWKDHAKLMRMVKLFLIDEVHILRDSRGATLEAVVSRMKSIGGGVRFVALSATVPNSEDIATWLGKNTTAQHLPAHREIFGENFRPTKLQKHVYGHPHPGNDFVFDKGLDARIPEILAKHSKRKPVMIFCSTRQICQKTAKYLAELWTKTSGPHRLWDAPSRDLHLQDPTLRETVSAGVAYHHAGIDAGDRREIEKHYLYGNLSIICCTSTLAVGVNLPCYLVIIKGTVSWTDRGIQEYPDLEMMQMLGRAGRPQFESSACAVILTRNEKVEFYQKLVSGQETLESCLHLNLIDHLNAEIGLGTVTDIDSAKKWLAGTFLFVRLQRNPSHYVLKEGIAAVNDELLLDQICAKDIKLLQEVGLATEGTGLRCTAFGNAMARYYVKFETMRIFMALPQKAKMSEMISAIAQAFEFQDLRLKSGQKSLFKEINKDNGIKFPIKVDIALPAHKVSLLLQAELGGCDFPSAQQFNKHKTVFNQDKHVVLQNVNRLIRCIIDCQVERQDSIAVRHGLELARSFGANVWDDSPLQLKQLDNIGNAAVRKLACAGINCIEVLEVSEPHRIERVLGRNPPFGMKLLSQLENFPKLRVSVKLVGKEVKHDRPVKIKVKAEIGFLNEKVPTFFNKRPIFICFLAELSDGRLLDFQRLSASKVRSGHEFMMTAEITSSLQILTCYVMCDDIAGTLRSAELKPELSPSLFPPTNSSGREVDRPHGIEAVSLVEAEPNCFGDDDLDDYDLLAAENSSSGPRGGSSNKISAQAKENTPLTKTGDAPGEERWEPTQLANGKWKCNHACKDRSSCKHLCCRDGLDKRPKPPKMIGVNTTEKARKKGGSHKAFDSGKFGRGKVQTPFQKTTNGRIQQFQDHARPSADAATRLQRLHDQTASSLSFSTKPTTSLPHDDRSHGINLAHAQDKQADNSQENHTSSYYDGAWANEIDVDDLPDPDDIFSSGQERQNPSADDHNFDFSDPDLETLLGMTDNQDFLQHTSEMKSPSKGDERPSSKRSIEAVDVHHDPYDYRPQRQRHRLTADFLDDSDHASSSDTGGRDRNHRELPTPEFNRFPKRIGLFVSSRSRNKKGQNDDIATTGKEEEGERGKQRLRKDGLGLSRPVETDLPRPTHQTGNQPDARIFRDITNHGVDQSTGNNGRLNSEDERARKQREQDAKWEGFDPEFVAQFKDLVELT